MSEYINRQLLLDAMEIAMQECVYNAPAADVEPVRHGTWERYEGYSELNGWGVNFRCSACHKFHFHNGELRRYKYCPHCGAKMDASQEDT